MFSAVVIAVVGTSFSGMSSDPKAALVQFRTEELARMHAYAKVAAADIAASEARMQGMDAKVAALVADAANLAAQAKALKAKHEALQRAEQKAAEQKKAAPAKP